MSETKVCTMCGDEKSLDKFDYYNKGEGRKTWRRSICKVCRNVRARERRALKKKNKPPREKVNRYYEVIEGGDCFRGKLPATGFRETVKAGYFPTGMVVERQDGKRFMVTGSKMVGL